MKKIGAYKHQGALVMALVFGWQLLTGTGFFCVNQFSHAFRSVGNDRPAHTGTTADLQDESANARMNTHRQNGTLPCNCKKKKKCPTIPRTTFASNPTYRFNELQRQFRSMCGEPLAIDLTGYRFALGSAPPFLESISGAPFYSATPLAITCVLLI